MVSTLLALAVVGAAMTPEEEVEAWQPKYVEIDASERRDGHRLAASMAVPIAAFVGGVAAGAGAGVGLGRMSVVDGNAQLLVAGAAGLLAFDAFLAAGLLVFLPPGLPPWTIPVAVAAASASASFAVALSLGTGYAYSSLVNPGCVGCGPEMLVALLAALMAGPAAAATATTLTTSAAAIESE